MKFIILVLFPLLAYPVTKKCEEEFFPLVDTRYVPKTPYSRIQFSRLSDEQKRNYARELARYISIEYDVKLFSFFTDSSLEFLIYHDHSKLSYEVWDIVERSHPFRITYPSIGQKHNCGGLSCLSSSRIERLDNEFAKEFVKKIYSFQKNDKLRLFTTEGRSTDDVKFSNLEFMTEKVKTQIQSYLSEHEWDDLKVELTTNKKFIKGMGLRPESGAKSEGRLDYFNSETGNLVMRVTTSFGNSSPVLEFFEPKNFENNVDFEKFPYWWNEDSGEMFNIYEILGTENVKNLQNAINTAAKLQIENSDQVFYLVGNYRNDLETKRLSLRKNTEILPYLFSLKESDRENVHEYFLWEFGNLKPKYRVEKGFGPIDDTIYIITEHGETKLDDLFHQNDAEAISRIKELINQQQFARASY